MSELCVCVCVCVCVELLGVLSVCISMQQLGGSRGSLSFPISDQSQVETLGGILSD